MIQASTAVTAIAAGVTVTATTVMEKLLLSAYLAYASPSASCAAVMMITTTITIATVIVITAAVVTETVMRGDHLSISP